MDQHGSSARIRGALAQESGWRRVLAYGFKLLSGFGAIAVAAGIPKQAAQLVGIAVAINVFLDTIFSNQPRLLIVTKAKYALGSVFESSENDCNDLSSRVLQIAARDKSEATDALIKGFNDLRSKLLRETQSVNKAVEESDVKFLETLALEKQKDRS